MALEKSLWAWLRKAREQLGDSLHMERVENLTAAGTPDVEGYLHLDDCQGQFWLELKSQERPSRRTTPLRFKLKDRDEQIEFMGRRWALGGNAFWFLQVGSASKRILYLAPGDLGPLLKLGILESELTKHCLPFGCYTGRVSQTDILRRVVICRKSRSITARRFQNSSLSTIN